MNQSKLFACLTFVALFLLGGCATTIPETDNVPPRVELILRGSGIGTKSISNPPREYWSGESGSPFITLQANTQYNFSVIVSDDGGVAQANFDLPKNFELLSITSENVTLTTRAIAHKLVITGNEDEPLTTLVISGSFRTRKPPYPISPIDDIEFDDLNYNFSLIAQGEDFGGGTGLSRNQRTLEINVELD